ncbi:MAG: hypothetical protein WD768_20555 [Phycisphaeraceae bacterium]
MTPSHAADSSDSKSAEVASLKAEVERLKGMVPDQAHAMADVGYHYSNLWFAGQNENWPLAQFMMNEVKSHLRWAVRIIPKRKTNAGLEVDLTGILGGLETSTLKDLEQTIKDKSKAKFTEAYKMQLTACMSCHQATSKEFIRLQVPERPEASILDFRPESAK